jgi:hypothetical protein
LPLRPGAIAADISRVDDLGKLLTYLRAHPEDPAIRVSIATGVSEQAIADLAQAGLLPVVPAGAEPKPACSCTGGARCPVCRADVARRIAQAHSLAQLRQPAPGTDASARTGMQSRRPRLA